MRAAIGGIGIALISVGSLDAHAQAASHYPSKVIRIIVPYSPAIGVDLAARVIAPKLAEQLGQSVIVENKAGASGLIGSEFVAKSPPDGHTLGMTVNSLVIAASTRTISFDVVRDFAPISTIGAGAFVLTAHAAQPFQNVRELVNYAKANPGKVNYGTPGAGTPGHLAAELLKQTAGIDLFHVPFKGMTAAVLGHVTGDVGLMVTPIELARPHVASGKLRPLAATGATRIPELPAVPTMLEAGYPEFTLDLWYGLIAPAGTPSAIVTRLNSELRKIVAQPEVQVALSQHGVDAQSSTPEEFGALIRRDLARWTKVAATAGIRLD